MRFPLALLSSVILATASTPAWSANVAVSGVSNFHQVNEHIYRGGQPSDEAWKNLSNLGVKTVIDLRPESEHSIKLEKQQVEAAGMHYVNVPLGGLSAPPSDTIAKLLKILEDAKEPVFIHCRRGADRTGTAIACYRIAHDGWTNQRALQEAVKDGMSWIEVGMRRYVMAFHPPDAPPAPPAPPSAPAVSSR